MDRVEREFLHYVREYTCTHMVEWGMPPQVHESLSHRGGDKFDFGAAIHLRLLDIWDCDESPDLLTLQRSVAAQLGMIDDEDGSVRAMLDEDGYWWKRPDLEASQVGQAIRRRLEKVKYLLVLENVPTFGEQLYASWLEESFPAPTAQSGCRVVLSTDRLWEENDIPWKSASRKAVDQRDLRRSESHVWYLASWVEGVASSMEKMTAGGIAMDIPEDDLQYLIVGSLVYWWLFKYWRRVPVAELLSSWVHAEILPMLLSARGRPAPPCSAWEVGKNLMAELCRQYLLKVKWGDDGNGGRCWCRKPLRAGGPLFRTGPPPSVDDDWARSPWTGVSLEYEHVLMAAREDACFFPARDLDGIATTFLANLDVVLRKPDKRTSEDDNYWLRSVTSCFVARYKTEDGDVGLEDIKNVPEPIMEMGNLRLLDLSDTNIISLPRSLFFNLPELRVLLLQSCKHLEAVVVPAAAETTSPTVDGAASGALGKLRVLDLSNSSVREISDDVLLRHMTNLQELILSNVSSLERPPTLRALGSLGIFRMTNSTALKEENLSQELSTCTSHVLRVLDLSGNPSIQSLPKTLFVAPSSTQLEEIHLLDCAGLERTFVSHHTGLMMLENMPSLRVFTLSGSSKIRRLSLRGCRRLETIKLSNLKKLVKLDLSDTGIVELPAEVFRLPCLRHLDLLGVQRLRRLPWLEGREDPMEFNLNTCSCSLTTLRPPACQVIKALVNIVVADPRILYPLPTALWWGVKYYLEPSFYVRISPCMHVPVEDEGPHPPKILGGRAACHIPYKAILASAKGVVKKEGDFSDDRDRLGRHVEVVGGGTGGASLKASQIFMSAADSLLLHDHHYTTSLTDIVRTLESNDESCNLQRCWLKRCHNMECVFADDTVYFPNLVILWVSKLPRLTRVWVNLIFTSFNNLKLIHLEYCPSIVSIFPHDIHLDALERLVIRSCPRLEHVFAPTSRNDELAFRKVVSLCQLQTMELLELPKLASISNVSVRSPCKTWKLKVRGCWRLCELPTFFTDNPATKVSDVKIDGEPLWRKNLVINNTITLAV